MTPCKVQIKKDGLWLDLTTLSVYVNAKKRCEAISHCYDVAARVLDEQGNVMYDVTPAKG